MRFHAAKSAGAAIRFDDQLSSGAAVSFGIGTGAGAQVSLDSTGGILTPEAMPMPISKDDGPAVDASIIIPAYNRRRRLEGTLGALESLDYPREAFEVILVDDGSEDDTGRFFQRQEYPFRFHCLRHAVNRGRSAARNSGVRKARGRVVVFLDDDMRAVPDLLREHLRHHRDDSRTVVLGNVHRAPEVAPTALIRYLDSRGVHKLGAGDPIPFRYFSAGNVSLDREFFIRGGLFDERFRSFGGEDLELGYRLSQRGARFIFSPGALTHRIDYRNIPETCRAMEIFGRDSLPLLLRIHPGLEEMFKLHRIGASGPRRAEEPFLLRPRPLRALFWAPWGGVARAAARALNRLWAPAVLFDYLILFHIIKGYRQHRRERPEPAAASG
jgi:glycosyltransferase involved in cell wall biosynthesis